VGTAVATTSSTYCCVVDLGDNDELGLFLQVYGTLPRAGPGGDEYTRRALGLVPGRRPRTVLDLGCGPGAQTVALAKALPDVRIVAVDLLPSMVAETTRRLAEANLEDRVVAVVGDMAEPSVPSQSQDVLWCEGAIYNVGVTEALSAWRPLLRPGGAVAFTEPIWLAGEPPAEIRDWWLSEYPSISDEAGVRSRIEAASYRTVASFVLPAAAWWDEYYAPMQDRIADMKARFPDDVTAVEIVAAAETEIDKFQRYSEFYSYAFFIVQPTT